MTQNEFVECAFAELPSISDMIDRDCVIDCLNQCYEDGFSLHDAIRYAYFTEHVSPQYSEEFACKRLAEIGKKYRSTKYRST